MSYKIIKNEFIKDIGEAFIYEHERTNAKIVYIKNDDNNKVFSITFRTPPSNNTGVFHILEHCVLAGSEKYPLKEPFNQLDKCTMNTYLNAITYADKTVYPVASTNDKDYFKLMNVYLDGVFNPLIKSKRGIFLQEGWYVNKQDDDINGIVYNEMQGAYSTEDVLIDFKVKQKLFEDNLYSYDSGGYPENITDLTYDDFIQTYDEYYNPSNSIIYFYGNLDIDYYLDYLDEKYLCKFDKGICHEIVKSNDLSNKIYMEDTYFSNDLDEAKNYIQATFKLKFSKDESKNIAFDMLADILTENQEGILKKALIEAGVCENVTSYIDDDMIEPVFTILIEETLEENIEKFKEILFKTIEKISREKIDDDLIKGAICTNEFFFKEGDFGYKPKGLFYDVTLLKHMVYDDFGFDCLKFDDIIETLQHMDYEDLLVQNILNNDNAVFCILKPTGTETKKQTKLTETENMEALFEYQNEVDTEENLDKIPPVSVSDIEREVFEINSSESNLQGIPLIYNEIKGDIFYLDFVFDISSLVNRVNEEYHKYMSIFVYMLGKLDTHNYSSAEFEKNISLYIGGASISNTTISNGHFKFFPALQFSFRVLNKNREIAISLFNELIQNTIFDDREKVRKLLLEFIHKNRLDAIYEPKDYCIQVAKSYVSSEFSYLNDIDGISFYYWLKDLQESISDDNKSDCVIDDIICKMLYIKENISKENNDLYVALSSNGFEVGKICGEISKLKFLKKVQHNNKSFEYGINKSYNEAFFTQSNVNFNTKVGLWDSREYKYEGSVNVLTQMLNSGYLWEKIRTEGGAYGSQISVDLDGMISVNSYHDPNISRTYENFNNISNYIKNLEISEKEVHIYKIGAINHISKPIKNCDINSIAIKRYFRGITSEFILKNKIEILDTSLKNIKYHFDYFENCFRNSKICTIGSKSDIFDDKHIFNNINKFL